MTGPADPSNPERSERPEIARLHAFPGEAPARADLRHVAPEEGWPGVATERLELVSRGDLVPGLLARDSRTASETATQTEKKRGGSKPALLLAIHDAGDSVRSPDLLAVAGWVAPGLALVAIELPLHGHRASPKLTERLLAGIAQREHGGALDRNGALLVDEFWRQATIDLVRTLDAMLALDAFDPKRIGLLGFGLGAALAQTLLTLDARPSAAVLIRPASASPSPSRSPSAAAAESPADSQARIAHAASRPEILTLERELGPDAWASRAHAFLASRLGV